MSADLGASGTENNPILNRFDNSVFDDFAAAIAPNTGAPQWLTYLGGSLSSITTGIAVDAEGRPFVTGATDSQDFPILNQIQMFGGLDGQLLQSTDGGNSFPALTGWPDTTAGSIGLNALAIDTANKIIYAGTITNGLWFSTDGGMTFGQITNAGFPNLPTAGFGALAFSNGTVYAGGNAGLYLLTNEGTSVAQASNLPAVSKIFSLTVGASPDTLYVGTNDGLYVSNDATSGAAMSFAAAAFKTGPGKGSRRSAGQNIAVFSSVLDAQGNLLVGTSKGVFVSTNGGKNFFKTNLNYTAVFSLAADTVSGIVYAGTVGDSVVVSTNDFDSFTFAQVPVTFPNIWGLAVDTSAGTKPLPVYAACQDFSDRFGWIVKSTDVGATFQTQGGPSPGLTNALVIDPTTIPSTIYAANFEQLDATVSALGTDSNGLIEILFSTFLGGPNFDEAEAIALDANDDAFVTGETFFAAFPTTTNAFEPTPVSTPAFVDAFVAEMPNSMPGNGSMTGLNNGTQLTFSKVTTAGQTSSTNSITGPALPPGYTLVGSAARSARRGPAASSGRTPAGTTASYYDFTTTAVFSGAVLVCIDYDPSQVGNPADVALLHYTGGNWQNVTTSNNSTKGVVCGEVTGFSPFAVATVQSPLTIKINPPAKAPVRIRLRKQGSLPVEIVSSQSFDATQIDPSTIRLSGASVELIDKGKKFDCHTASAGHHLKNLICTTNLGELALAPGANLAVLTATTNAGQLVQGAEAVKIVTK